MFKCFVFLSFLFLSNSILAGDDFIKNYIIESIATVEKQYSKGIIDQEDLNNHLAGYRAMLIDSGYPEKEIASILRGKGVLEGEPDLDDDSLTVDPGKTESGFIDNDDNEGPVIFLAETIMSTNIGRASIDGHVNDDSIVQEIIYDDKPIKFDPSNNNSFSFGDYVPKNGKKVLIQAIDQWGNIGSKTIKLFRPKVVKQQDFYANLNPFAKVGKKKSDSLAIIIGVEKYENTFSAPFAKRDAELFYDFASNIMGIPQENITLLINKEATLVNTIKTIRKLKNKITKNKTDIYLFFSGHGLASTEDSDVYLFPYNGDPEVLDISALKRDEIFQQIADYEPASVTVFLDTCYSGATRSNELLIASAKPIFLEVAPTNIPSNFTLISASANNQIASSLDGAEHGLFSYYLMKGLEGGADNNDDKKITSEEIFTFVAAKVEVEAFNIGRTQTPQIIGDRDKILVQW